VNGKVTASLVVMVFVSLALVLVVGVVGLYVAEADYLYIGALVIIVAGFALSFSWYISEANLLDEPKSKPKSKSNLKL